MKPSDLDEYEYLWQGDNNPWVLLRGTRGHTIYNQRTKMALVIEDDEKWSAVTKMMIEKGVQLLDKIPD